MPPDAKTAEFMRLVECDESEVKQIPPGRRHVKHDKKREPLFKGGPVMTFGVHKGKHMSEVDKRYLQWCLDQPASSQWFADVQDQIRSFLG